MTKPLAWIKKYLFKANYEPEYEETVEHDIVIVDGQEVTANDSEEG